MSSSDYLDVGLIHPCPTNVRDKVGDVTELADSIREQGILQPLTVRRHPARAGHFELVAGHRRYAAARLVGLDRVPVTVRFGVADDGKVVELMLVENCHRSDLDPIEKAEAMGRLVGLGYTGAEIARRTGISPSAVSYHLTLLELDEGSRAKVRAGQVAVTDAVAAVRRARRKRREKARADAGRPTGENYAWEPDHLAGTHPLARKASRTCDARGHTMRRRLGDTACGQCWETVIREDERVAVAASAALAADSAENGSRPLAAV